MAPALLLLHKFESRDLGICTRNKPKLFPRALSLDNGNQAPYLIVSLSRGTNSSRRADDIIC